MVDGRGQIRTFTGDDARTGGEQEPATLFDKRLEDAAGQARWDDGVVQDDDGA